MLGLQILWNINPVFAELLSQQGLFPEVLIKYTKYTVRETWGASSASERLNWQLVLRGIGGKFSALH